MNDEKIFTDSYDENKVESDMTNNVAIVIPVKDDSIRFSKTIFSTEKLRNTLH